MLRRYASVIVMVFLVGLVGTACVVRTHPPRRGTTVIVREHDNGKHKQPKPPKKHKDDHGHDD